ncbi:Ldh family oxidoreductase [Herbaspirillum chlorophenolicum]|uniref:Ldh family oxidoreductase n=1 Tax=Herbaspirillum chlorophenolicum TaxID=211589 RepID=A0ABW8F0D3_9BURK
MKLNVEEATGLARKAAMSAGANEKIAASLANATVAAEVSGRPAVGFAHLPDYLEGFASGRISCDAQPDIDFPTATTIRADAKNGIAQLGFDLCFDRLVDRAKQYGVALFSQSNSYTAGELGYYTRRLAGADLVSIAVSNGPALVTTMESRQPVFGTNPFSFGAPVANGSPLVIDQASSATAFVNVRDAASRGEPIPDGWAVDQQGIATTNAQDALTGMLLAFGGSRGANIALLVEVLAAGVTGANWSIDAPSFEQGEASPGVGLFVVAIDPKVFAPDFPARLASQIDRLTAKGLYVPGRGRKADDIVLKLSVLDAIRRYFPSGDVAV